MPLKYTVFLFTTEWTIPDPPPPENPSHKLNYGQHTTISIAYVSSIFSKFDH